VSLPGYLPKTFTVAAGAGSYVTFPQGTIGGPVKVVSDQAVLASQRVQFNQSFNEVVARSAAQATTASYMNWFDRASPGMTTDNIHILNPGGASASVTVTMPGANPLSVTVAAGAQTYVAFPAGKIGGPVKVSSTAPVLATQRVQFYDTFNEVASLDTTLALTACRLLWFDKATPGMVANNLHFLNPGSAAASVSVSLPGVAPIAFNLAPGAENYVSFPAGTIGGPITINTSQPVLAAQRVQYYQSFNEVPAA
jgi:hypothetical protein